MNTFIVLLVVVVAMTAYGMIRRHKTPPQPCKEEVINALTRQAYRWYIASTQDQHPLIKNLHINYAVGYISALRDVASEDEIREITGLDTTVFAKQAIREQDKALILLTQTCPKLTPDDPLYQKYLDVFLK